MNAADEIKVSIICNAYNHEAYIRSALEGFVMQKTDFAFEILVHDDASTDQTADIIREYEAKYPDLIKPIYQTENQYSKGLGAPRIFQEPRVTGKYVAFCEGDDYWTDPLKLQKQYDAMEAHPELDICATGALHVNCQTGKTLPLLQPSDHDTIFSVEQVIAGGGGFVATASLFFRADILKDPPRFRSYLHLDYTLQICGSLRGGMLYLCDLTTVYRAMAEGSWTSRTYSDAAKWQEQNDKMAHSLAILNEETSGRYQAVIQQKILEIDFDTRLARSEERKLLTRPYRSVLIALPFKEQLKIYLKAAFPFLKKWKRKIIKSRVGHGKQKGIQ